MCLIKYSTVVNEKLEAQAKQFLLVWQIGFRKGRYCIDASFTMKALTEKRRYNLETCLICLHCLKAFDRVIRQII